MTKHFCDWCGKEIYKSAPTVLPAVYQDKLRGENVGDLHFMEDEWAEKCGNNLPFLTVKLDICPACVKHIGELGEQIKEAHHDS